MSGQEAIDIPSLLGFGPEPDTLLVETLENGDPVWRLLSLKNGTFGPSMAERGALEGPLEDRITHRMIGGVHMEDTRRAVKRACRCWNPRSPFYGPTIRRIEGPPTSL